MVDDVQEPTNAVQIIIFLVNELYEGQSNENGSEAKTYNRTLITSKVISNTVYTFMPLLDKIINLILEKTYELYSKPFPYPVTHFFVGCKTMSTKVFFNSPKMEHRIGEIWAIGGVLRMLSIVL